MVSAQPLRLHVVIPLHQPLSASQSTLAHAVRHCYAPLLTALQQTPGARVSLHLGGHVLDYLAQHDEALLLRLKEMRLAGQIEILSGLFYGGITSHLNEQDIRGQIEMAREYWESCLGSNLSGFWLHALAWSAELPRLFADTGLLYGFVSDSQLQPNLCEGAAASLPALGRIERAGDAVTAFVCDAALSRRLPDVELDAWVREAQAAAQLREHHSLAVWVRAESLGLEPQTASLCTQAQWLQRWLTALSTHAELSMCLPAEAYTTLRPSAAPLRLYSIVAPELQPTSTGDDATQLVTHFADFPQVFSEVNTLYRRMLRCSSRLRDAMGRMEDEGLEDSWSDTLATAQRLLFAAQSPDVYWRGLQPGFADPALRDATQARLLQAENLLDALHHKTPVAQSQADEAPLGTWISCDSDDLDGDLAPDVLVATAHVHAWIAPQRGGQIYVFEDRHAPRNLLDVGSRRAESYFAAMQTAPTTCTTQHGPYRQPGSGLRRLSGVLPQAVEAQPRHGIRQFIGPLTLRPEAFFAGQLRNSLAMPQRWEISQCGIDTPGDTGFVLSLQAHLKLPEAPGSVQLKRRIQLPRGGNSLQLHCELQPQGEACGIYGVEIPLRLGTQLPQLRLNGTRLELPAAPSQPQGDAPLCWQDVTQLEVLDAQEQGVRLQFATPCAMWCLPIYTTLRSVDGYSCCAQGIVLVPHMMFQQHVANVGAPSLTFELRVQR